EGVEQPSEGLRAPAPFVQRLRHEDCPDPGSLASWAFTRAASSVLIAPAILSASARRSPLRPAQRSTAPPIGRTSCRRRRGCAPGGPGGPPRLGRAAAG